MTFSEEEKQTIEQLAGTLYTIPKIAMYFGIDPILFQAAYEEPDSVLRYHYDRGILIKEANRDIALTKAADNGSAYAVQQIEKRMKDRFLSDFKHKLLNGY